jgi:NADH dehydrogenase [ubiquinone] 1 alpha subcomplex assembly factor 1
MLRRLVDFDAPADVAAWRAVDDVVMGGVSRSALQQAGPGVARFTGVVSLERGGGFASIRTEPRAWSTAGADAFVLHCRGDGHTYKFTVRTEDSFDGVQYQQRFTPPAGTWHEVRLPVADFVPSFRGREVAGAAPLDAARVRQLGLMISDRQPGPFELLLDWIAVSADAS